MTDSASLDLGSVVMFPVSEPGSGGIGQHVMQVRDHLVVRGTTVQLGPLRDQRPTSGTDRWKWMGSSPEVGLDEYDRWCAESQLSSREADAVIALPGAALRTFRATPRGVRKLLLATNLYAPTHRSWAMDGIRRAPLERSWLTRSLMEKMAREAELADTIISNSNLTTRTFVEAGIPTEKVVLIPLRAREFDVPDTHDDDVDILYIGALAVEKGVVDLIRAFSRVRDRSLRLRLMGGPRSPGMNAYLKRAVARDDRIHVSPGDPSRQLPAARLLVHASYADSFSYAVAEAVAAGIPVVTTDRVGASDLIREGRSHPSSRVLPAGDGESLFESITEILGTT